MPYAYRIDGEHRVKLSQFDPDDHGKLDRDEAEEKSARLGAELVELQALLSGAAETSLLIVLQGRDTSGKDGTIRHVTGPLNAQGCSVASFKVPTAEELAHDFLWRIHKQVPARGEIRIFNRSHYEDVLVARVHELVPPKAWRARYDQINQFERILADAGTTILKFYLHISRDEQEERLLDREKDRTKFWKLSAGDWKERDYWDAYTEAYEDALNRCATSYAPWYVVPANHKWFRDLAVTEVIVDALAPMKKEWLAKLEEIGRTAKAEIETMRNGA